MVYEFKDKLVQDKERTVVSIRDGFQEYLGAELGMQPSTKVFKVYRSPRVVTEASKVLIGIPLTDDHIDLAITDVPSIGEITTSTVAKGVNKATDSTVVVKNTVFVDGNVVQLTKDKELSLGYTAEMVEHDVYDLEQVNIVPHHLAVVDAGRCGSVCKFKDERKTMGIVKEPEAKTEAKVIDEVTEAEVEEPKELTCIEKMLSKLGELSAEELEQLSLAIVGLKADEEAPIAKEEVIDVVEEAKEEAPVAKEEAVEVAKEEEDFKDSITFKDAVTEMANYRVDVILKAKGFLDTDYDFKQDTVKVMKDALATQSKEAFEDKEVDVAFKMLKKTKDYSQFSDTKSDIYEQLKNKEL